MANQWQIRLAKGTRGPFTDSQLQQLLKSGRINSETPVRNGENGSWLKAGTVPLLSGWNTPTAAESGELDSIFDEVLGNVIPASAEELPFSELPQGWERPKKPDPPKAVPPIITPQVVPPPTPVKQDAETVPNYDGFQTLTGLFAFLGFLSFIGVFLLALQFFAPAGTESGLPRSLAISAVANAVVQALGLVVIAAIFSGIRDALRSLRRIAISNDQIVSHLRKPS